MRKLLHRALRQIDATPMPCRQCQLQRRDPNVPPLNEKGWYDMTWDVIHKGSKAKYFVVPDGTTITAYAPHGFAISEELGRAIQLGTLRPEQFRVTYQDRTVSEAVTQALARWIAGGPQKAQR